QISDLLTLCFVNAPMRLAELTLLDHGGGSGVMSLFALELGVGTVVYNDIYDVSCADATRLAQAVDLRLEHSVCGDVDAIVSYLEENGIELNAAVSYDVLEHIYDIPGFLRAFAAAPISERFFRMVFASSANIKNRRYLRNMT